LNDIEFRGGIQPPSGEATENFDPYAGSIGEPDIPFGDTDIYKGTLNVTSRTLRRKPLLAFWITNFLFSADSVTLRKKKKKEKEKEAVKGDKTLVYKSTELDEVRSPATKRGSSQGLYKHLLGQADKHGSRCFVHIKLQAEAGETEVNVPQLPDMT
jgi:hypothetical protein